MGDEGEPISFLGRRLPAAFELHVVVVAPGGVHAYDSAEWRDAIVLVEHGVIELVYSAGGGRVCQTGDVLWLDGLPVRALRNTRDEPVVLVAVSRSVFRRPPVTTGTARAWVAPTTRGSRP